MRKKLLLVALLVILSSIITTGTWAYFTASKTTVNVITMGNIDIDIVETMVDDEGNVTDFADQSGVMAGATVSKIVTLENTGFNDAWVRIWVTQTMTDPDGNALDAGVMSFTLGEDWLAHEDGYYYYTLALEAGATTTPLWEEILFDPFMGNEYQGATGTIEVTAHGVQVANNPIPENGDVTDILGWPE